MLHSRSTISQRGMALIVVLWMLAVLSLFAASLGSQVRDRANQALVQRYLVQGRATGEAAIFLALQQIQQQFGQVEFPQRRPLRDAEKDEDTGLPATPGFP